jgi:steroid 5-alpha reductase family enzyme
MLIQVFLGLFLFFNIFFLIGLIKKDFSVIDIAWGLSFFLVWLISWIASGVTLSSRLLLIGVITGIWAFRLSGYIFYRSLKKGQEDYRYAAWRKEWGSRVNQTAYIRVYMLQLILALIIASPLILVFKFETKIIFGTTTDLLGLALWIIGFLFEAIGDYQKNKFKSILGNQDKFCDIGLWKYTRHPNYFGEALLWWGIFFIVINAVPIYFAICSPILLSFLLLKVSGVAMLEKTYEKRPGFEEYKKTTNRFIPWFVKRKNK